MKALKNYRIVVVVICSALLLGFGCEKKPVLYFSKDIEWTYLGKNIGPSKITPAGVIYAGDATTGDLIRSVDGGRNWETIVRTRRGEDELRCLFVSSRGSIFISRDRSGELKKRDPKGKTFNRCLKLSDSHASVIWGMAENRKGWLYAGEYSNIDFKETCAYIYRSKNDGKDWETVYRDPKARHVHFVAVDPYTDYIYAATGDFIRQASLVRSKDGGESWEILGNSKIDPKIDWKFTSVVFTPGYRIFGEDDPLQSDLIRTADDRHFKKVLVLKGPEKHNFWAWGRKDGRGNIFFGSWTQHAALRKQMKGIPKYANGVIYLSRDDGSTWEKVVDFGLRKYHSGTHYASNVTDGNWIFTHATGKSIKFRLK